VEIGDIAGNALYQLRERNQQYAELLTDLIELSSRWQSIQGDTGCYILPIHDLNQLLINQPGISDEEPDDADQDD
jgi:hypothetical protein